MATLSPYLRKLKDCQPPLGGVFCNKRDLLNGQSSPGTLQVGQHPSKGTRQIPLLAFFWVAVLIRFTCVPLPLGNGVPLFDDDLHGVVDSWFERRVCLSLCTRRDRGTFRTRGAFALHVKCDVLPAGCQRCRGKKRRHPRLGRGCWNVEVVWSCSGKVVGLISA